jgi:hypothetical protein
MDCPSSVRVIGKLGESNEAGRTFGYSPIGINGIYY